MELSRRHRTQQASQVWGACAPPDLHCVSAGLRVWTGPSYEIQPRLPESALEKVPDSNAHDDHEDQDYEPSIHLLPLGIRVRIETIAQSAQ
jgi:hypothetical protein